MQVILLRKITNEGFQCDFYDYVLDDLYSITNQLYGGVVEIRTELI